jgi:hypothetical protein
MPLLGNAAVAMWWTIAPEGLAEFREWHSKEHFPERMGIPGFLRGSRWEAEGGAHFVMYELEDYAVLTSDGYRASLNNPTAWSRKMMPLHSGMVRSQCRIASSQGGGVATFTATVTLSPRAGAAEALGIALDRVLAGLPSREGITAAHRLITDTPQAAATTEQQIRGADRAADWIVLVCGHQRDALLQALSDELSAAALERHRGTNVKQSGPYRLVHAVTPADFRPA